MFAIVASTFINAAPANARGGDKSFAQPIEFAIERTHLGRIAPPVKLPRGGRWLDTVMIDGRLDADSRYRWLRTASAADLARRWPDTPTLVAADERDRSYLAAAPSAFPLNADGVGAMAAPSPVAFNFNDGDGVADSGLPIANVAVGAFTTGNQNGMVTSPINTSSASSGYAGASGEENIGVAARTGALVIGSGGSAYLSITFDADPGYFVNITDFDFAVRSTTTGAQAYSLRSSTDGFATELVGGTIANNSNYAFKNNAAFNFTATTSELFELRLYFFNGAGMASVNTINTRVDDITIAVGSVPEPAIGALIAPLALLLRRRRRA